MEATEQFDALEFGGDGQPEALLEGQEGVPEEQEPQTDEQEIEQDKREKKSKKGKEENHKDWEANKIDQAYRERYQALEELQRQREENERLRRYYADSMNMAQEHYEDSLKLRLDRAKQLKAQALETGDVEAQVNADIELASISSDFQAFKRNQANEKLKSEYQVKEYEQQQKQQQAYQQQVQQASQGWINENANWFHPNSPNYDPQLAGMVNDYSKQIEHQLQQSGRSDLIYSPAYFNEINGYIANVKNNAGRLNMKPSRSGVEPVRHSNGHNTDRPTFKLSADERDLARRLGVSEKDYLQRKVKDMQENPRKRGGL